MRRVLLPFVLLLGLGASCGLGVLRAQDPQPAGPSNTQVVCESLVKQQMSALNLENPDGVMLVFHPEAPNRLELQRTLVQQFRMRDLRYKLLSLHFVAEDGPYAYMRMVQIVDGSREKTPFKGESELLLVFRKSTRGWKAWTSVRLRQKKIS